MRFTPATGACPPLTDLGPAQHQLSLSYEKYTKKENAPPGIVLG